MAGVGFKIREMITRESYGSLFRAYTYSGIIGAGTWLISIFAILFTVFFIHHGNYFALYIRQFQVSVTGLIVSSLILSSSVQHSYTRYVSDRLFEKKPEQVLPSLMSICLVVTVICGVLIYSFINYLFKDASVCYRLCFASTFVILANIWPCSNLLAGLKKYTELLICFSASYLIFIAAAFLLRTDGLSGLMVAFMLSQFFILLGMLMIVFKYFFSNHLIDFDYFSRKKTYVSLVFASLFFNLGVWIDKIIFWAWPETSHHVIGVLRASTIYVLPMFFAFLSMIPGFAVFVFRVEADFSVYYDYYFRAVRDGGTFKEIVEKRDQLVIKSRAAIFDLIKMQSIIVLFVYLFGESLLSYFRVPTMHFYLLRTDTLSVTFFLMLIAITNMLFYLDKRILVLNLSLFFLVSNAVLTLITLRLGILYYGYGFCASLFLTCLVGLYCLDKHFRNLEYSTFMLRKV